MSGFGQARRTPYEVAMAKELLIGVAGLFLAAGFAAGQPEPLVIHPQPAQLGPPVAPPEEPAFPAPSPGPPPGVFSAEADILLWTAKTPKDTFAPPGRTSPGGRFGVGYWLTEPNPWVWGEGIRT